MERRRRVEAYGLVRDERGRVLLVADRWSLPGDTVAHGEHPASTLGRAFATYGLRVEVGDIREVTTDIDIDEDAERPTVVHHDRLVFDAQVLSGHPDGAEWVDPGRLEGLPTPGFTARALGLPLPPVPSEDQVVVNAASLATHVVGLAPPARHQRFAAYALATDPAGRVLLARIAPGYPGAGRWHLPGGGTDFGESAADGLLRELVEETNQVGRVTGLMSVSHRHQLDAMGPERTPIDWHGVRVVFRAVVDKPTAPRVMEGTGSTQAASWFGRDQAARLDLTEVARDAVERLDAS